MNIEKYKSLNYDHYEINELLNKVNNGMVLSKEEYIFLFETLKLNKINEVFQEFDGSYKSLRDLPNIHNIATEITKHFIDALKSELVPMINSGDEDLREDLEVHLDAYHELLFNMEDGLVTLDENFKAELRKELDECLILLTELENLIKKTDNNKADKEHEHTVDDLSDIEDRLSAFDLQLRTDYALDDMMSISHTHPKEIFDITKEDIDNWNNIVLTLIEIQKLDDTIKKIKNDYIATEELIYAIKSMEESLVDFVKIDDFSELLNTKAEVNHTHELQGINNLEYFLDTKVNKERNKVLINIKTLNRIENFLTQQDILQNGKQEHGHGNHSVLESISADNLDYWNSCIDETKAKLLISQEIKNSSLNDLINNSFYTKEEINDLIECSELATVNKVELEDRLHGLTFIPLTQEEFNSLDIADKEDPSMVYIITDSVTYEQDMSTFVTGEQLEDRMVSILENQSIITEELLDKRLDYLTFKQIGATAYKQLVDNNELEDGVLYVVNDTPDIDMSIYLTKEDLEKRIGDPLDSINRPEDPEEGLCYYDKTLKKPIWFNGEVWIDALGNPV